MSGIIYLEDGTIYTGIGFGHKGTSVGEIIFNTTMIGYEGVLADSTSAGHIVTLTYPIIGSYGIDKSKIKKSKLGASGLIVKDLAKEPSNYQSDQSLDEFLKEMKIVGVYDVDTRAMTKKIKSVGSIKCVITNEELSVGELEKLIEESELNQNYLEKCLVEKSEIKGQDESIAVLDLGASEDLIEVFSKKDCHIKVYPYGTSYEEIDKEKPSGLFVGNGPGDPKKASQAFEVIKKFAQSKKPVFGVDLGHQVIALAMGGDTKKMKHGHRGGNHGVCDIKLDKSYIVSQNHGFVVDEESIKKDFYISHRNLNDQSVEGISHKTLPIFSVQFHPQHKTSFKDTEYLFDEFIENCKGVK